MTPNQIRGFVFLAGLVTFIISLVLAFRAKSRDDVKPMYAAAVGSIAILGTGSLIGWLALIIVAIRHGSLPKVAPVLLALLLPLAACGGGGVSGPSTVPVPPAPAAATVRLEPGTATCSVLWTRYGWTACRLHVVQGFSVTGTATLRDYAFVSSASTALPAGKTWSGDRNESFTGSGNIVLGPLDHMVDEGSKNNTVTVTLNFSTPGSVSLKSVIPVVVK